MPAPTPIKPAVQIDPLSKLAALASDIRKIASAIEEVALNIETATHSNDEELEKLRALKNILKGL